MASYPAKTKVLTLYKALLRESSKFQAYNFRMYALRRTRDGFRRYKNICDTQEISKQISEGERNLEIIKRQVLIDNLYAKEKLVIENIKTP